MHPKWRRHTSTPGPRPEDINTVGVSPILTAARGGSPLLAPGPDGAAMGDEVGAVSARTPALYCSCGVVRAPDSHRGM